MDIYKEWLELQKIREQITEIEKKKKTIQAQILEELGSKRKIKLPTGRFLIRKEITVEEHVVPTYSYEKLVEAAK